MNSQTSPDPSEAALKDSDTAIIRPIVGRKSPKLGPLGVMISSGPDFESLVRVLPAAEHPSRMIMSRLFIGPTTGADARYAIIGPVVGAPYAVMLLEPLITWGVREICFIGWCGAISPNATIGDIIIPSGAIVDEGTSLGYDASLLDTVHPSETLNQRIKAILAGRGCEYLEGLVWSTDAIYRETPAKVAGFQAKNALAVEMELSALFTVGRYRGVQVSAALVVSDELTTFSWKPGFKVDRFRESRRTLIKAMKELCQNPL